MRLKNIVITCGIVASLGVTSVLPTLAAVSEDPSANSKSATVMIAIFNAGGDFTGWGTGFYVDERIIVTNKHIILGGQYYRIYATGADDSVNMECFRNLTRSDVKINLDDDVAYMRASLPCEHGAMYFADADVEVGDSVGILGYPYKGSLKESMHQSRTTGTVTGWNSSGTWLRTSAFVDFGNSGGPVVKDDRVVGVVVAKSVDMNGNFISGLFIPSSQIVRGLTYANNSTFGYIPQSQQSNAAYQTLAPQQTGPMSDSDCSLILGEGGRAADNGQCRCMTGFTKDYAGSACIRVGSSSSSSSSLSSLSSSSSSASSRSSVAPLTGLQMRTCARVKKQFFGESLRRVNERLMKRLRFSC